MNRDETMEYVYRLAKFLCKNNTSIRMQTLTKHLQNNNAFAPSRRGMGKFITAVYHHIEDTINQKEAEYVANAYKNAKGKYAWK